MTGRIVLQATRLPLQPTPMNPMNDSQLTALVSMFVGQLPILIISLLGCVVIMARKNELGAAWTWAMMGFGLSIVLCVLIPLTQTFVQRWVLEGGTSVGQRASLFTVLALVWSVFRAVSYGLLLMAIVVGRPARQSN
jgi:predicted permease